jgi:hypothetical protein
MRVLLLLAALGFASPVVAATPAPPPAPVSAPSQTTQDVRKDDSRLLPPMHNDDRRIQIRPGTKRPNAEKAGPGIG